MSSSASTPPDLSRLTAIQRAVQRLATSPEAPASVPAAFLDAGVHEADALALSAHPAPRLGVYGGLVGGTVLSAMKSQLPTSTARIPEVTLLWMVQRFLEEEMPRSRYLRDVPFELAIWAHPHWPESVPVFFRDLLRYELFLFAAGTAERASRPASGSEPLAADRGVHLDSTVHLGRFDFAVHRVPLSPEDTSEPEPRPTFLLAYRDGDNGVRELELTPAAMEILQRLAAGEPLGHAIARAAEALGRTVDAPLIEGISTVLADLASRGALLGPSPVDTPLPDRAEHSPYHRWLFQGTLD